jgi:hypothetical protein
MHFSNLCLQIGYTYLDAREWVAGLEEMERLASSAEESLRKARRRRIGLALQPERPEKTVKGDSVSAGDTPLTAFSSFGPISHQACSLLVDETTVGYSKTDDEHCKVSQSRGHSSIKSFEIFQCRLWTG